MQFLQPGHKPDRNLTHPHTPYFPPGLLPGRASCSLLLPAASEPAQPAPQATEKLSGKSFLGHRAGLHNYWIRLPFQEQRPCQSYQTCLTVHIYLLVLQSYEDCGGACMYYCQHCFPMRGILVVTYGSIFTHPTYAAKLKLGRGGENRPRTWIKTGPSVVGSWRRPSQTLWMITQFIPVFESSSPAWKSSWWSTN